MPARQGSGRIHRELSIVCAPAADDIIIFQAKAQRVHTRMAGRASRARPMLFQLLAHAGCRTDGRFVQIRYARRRRRRRIVQEIVENPFAANHGRSAGGIRGDRQHTGLRQHAATLFAGQFHAAERRAFHVRNAVEFRQRLIQERELTIDEIQNTAVLADHRVKKEPRFLAHGVTKLLVKIREAIRIRLETIEIAKLQPLSAEVIHQRHGFRIS